MARAGESRLRFSGLRASADDLGRGQKLRAAAGQRAALASALPENLLTRRSDPPRVKAALQAARKSSDADGAVLSMVEDVGLIHDIGPAAEIVSRIAQDAERLLTGRVTRFIRK